MVLAMFLSLRKWLLQLAESLRNLAARGSEPLRRPNISVWRSWEMVCRAGGLGAIGVSVIAQGGHVQPPSLIFGSIVIAMSTYCAFRAGEMEADNDRFN